MKGGIRQRSPGTWELTLNLGRDPQGIRRRRSVTVRGTKAQAQRQLRELLADFDKGIAPPDPVLIRDWLDRWMAEHIIPRRNQATSERYAAIIATHLKPRFGQLELNRLTPAQVRVMESDLVDGGLSPKSVALIHNVLSGAYRYAMQMEMIQRNPVSLVSPPPLRKTETVAPPIEAVQQLLELAELEEHRRFACIHLLAYTGLRLGEALALKWDAVDLEDGCLLVLSSVRRLRTGYVVSPPKTASGERKVDLDGKTVEVLRRHRERQNDLKSQLGAIYQDDGKVFCDGVGGWLDQARITLAVKKLGERVGCPGITSRSLRHFHASVALQQGTNIVVVSKRLGHANVSITSNIYAHSLPGWQKQAAEDFAAAMDQARQRPVIETE